MTSSASTTAAITAAAATCNPPNGTTLPIGGTRLRFGTPEPPTIPNRVGGGTTPYNPNLFEHQNRYAPLKQHGSESGDQGSVDLTSGILRGGSASVASSSRGSRGREPIPLTPEILLLLDRLEPDKGRQTRLLSEHLTWQRTLPCTKEELAILLERKADKEIKRQQAAAETAAN